MNTQLFNRYTQNLNLIQTWIHSVLYYREVYPEECFHEKTIFNSKVVMANSGPLSAYIDDFMRNLDAHEGRIKQVAIKVVSVEDPSWFEKAEISIEQFPPTELQWTLSELNVKKFIEEMKEQLQKYNVIEDQTTFELEVLMEESSDRKQMESLLDHWELAKNKTSRQILGRAENQIEICCLKQNSAELICTFHP